MTQIKICGITDKQAMRAAVQAGADFIGLVFYPHSPRFISPEKAGDLAEKAGGVTKVGLFVDPAMDEIAATLAAVPLDMIQLHGSETAGKVSEIKKQTGLPAIKALRLKTAADLKQIKTYEEVADWLLFDARSDSAPGGTGESFDWDLLRDFMPLRPWMLSGGLNTGNVGGALSILKPQAVDVSSGVESTRGIKDPGKIKEFIAQVRKNS